MCYNAFDSVIVITVMQIIIIGISATAGDLCSFFIFRSVVAVPFGIGLLGDVITRTRGEFYFTLFILLLYFIMHRNNNVQYSIVV